MRPVGPDVPAPWGAMLNEMQDAIRQLQQPGRPVVLPSVTLIADLPAAADYKECGILCDEINSLVVSTLVTGTYAWTRADGTAV